MPNYNRRHYTPRRTRIKSCPAGVTFEVNDISDYSKLDGLQESSSKILLLAKENNFSERRRGSFPSAKHNSISKETSLHLLNYSNVAGGTTDCPFYCKLVGARHMLTRSQIDVSNQHKCSNGSVVHDSFVASFRSELPLDKAKSLSSQNLHSLDSRISGNHVAYKINPSCKKRAVDVYETTFNLPEEVENSSKALANINETAKHLDDSFHSKFLEEVNGLEVIDCEDNLREILHDRHIFDLKDLTDADLHRFEFHIYGTELLVENLASQVEEAKQDIEMSKKKQENEMNDLISLNEEMQTIWSEKESSVREVLDRFAAYRDAVEADSKEKDEIYAEELNKREMIIKDLQLTKDSLEEELQRTMKACKEIINDVENFDASHAKQLVDVTQLVTVLLETLSDQQASVVCQSICIQLETSIAAIKGKDYTRYINCLSVNRTGVEPTEELRRNHSGFKLRKSFSSSLDEGTGYSILSSSDGERNEHFFPDNASGSALNNELVNRVQFSADDFSSCTQLASGSDEFYENLEEDFEKVLKEIEELGNDGLVNGFVDRKIVVRLLEEQRSKYQVICKEKDDEIQHWIRKHKQDTKDLHSILEEEERNEAKSNELLAELQNEIEKLRQRNKFLESEIEFTKEQGEDDVCLLKESFQKDLSVQLRRQSQSFLCAEESTKNQLAELESKNEELRKSNEDLRRQNAEHCTKIKSWVSDILLLSEEEYNEECESITDVLAKLQKIIIQNKRTMEELQQELNEHRRKVNEPSSPTDTLLSRSWGGHSWNSMELPKDVCRNCRQAKWQHVLMGSFDLVESGLEVKQDEVESLVDKLSVDETKHRKKHSLKDSLELADDQVDYLQRLSRQGFDSLETLHEDSVEEDEGAMLNDFSGEVKKIEVDNDIGENCNENWRNIHVSPRILNQYSILSDPECDGLTKKVENSESGDSASTEIVAERSQDLGTNPEVEIIHGKGVGDKEEQWWIEQDNRGQDEDRDRVQVVNLYRSLIVESYTPQDKDFVDGRMAHNETAEHQSDQSSDASGDHIAFEANSDDKFGKEPEDEVDDEDEESDVARKDPLPIPKIVIGKDLNDNEIQYNEGCIVEENYLNEKSETSSRSSETSNEDSMNLSGTKDNGILVNKIDSRDESKTQSDVVKSMIISTDARDSVFEFTGNVHDETPCISCIHCSENLNKNLETFQTKITEIISNQRKDHENKILGELEETRTELRKFQSEYEKMEKLCDDYRSYIDEYSENLRRKNEELRKLKLNSGIMKTEIEWLRQALGLTRNYEEF